MLEAVKFRKKTKILVDLAGQLVTAVLPYEPERPDVFTLKELSGSHRVKTRPA